MNFFALSGLFTAITSVFLVIKNFWSGRQKYNIVFGALCFAVLVWGIGVFEIASTLDYEKALIWWKIGYTGVIFIPIFLYHFVSAFINKKRFWLFFILYLIGACFSYANFFTDKLIVKLRLVFGQFYYISEPTILYSLLVCFFLVLVFLSLLEIFLAYKHEHALRRSQLKYIFIAFAIGFGGGSFDFLPVYRIDIYPVLDYLISFGNIIVLYTVIHYRLVDIRLALKNLFVYLILIFYVVFWFFSSSFFFQKMFGSIFVFDAYAFSVFLSLIFIFSFEFSKKKLGDLADRYLFLSLYNTKKIILQFLEVLPQYNSFEDVIRFLFKTLKKSLNPLKVGLVLLDKKGKCFQPVLDKDFGFSEKINKICTMHRGFLVSYLIKTRTILVKDEFLILAQETEDVENKKIFESLLSEMKGLGIYLCVPLITNDKLIGFIILGAKPKQESFSREDLELLNLLAYPVATSITTSLLYKEVKEFNKTLNDKVKEQTQDIVAKNAHLEKLLEMKSEFLDIASHQLKTPITVIKGTLSMFEDGTLDGASPENKKKLLSNVLEKAEHLNAIVTDILKASEVDSGGFKVDERVAREVNLNELFPSIISRIKDEAQKKNLELIFEEPLDKKLGVLSVGNLLEQVFFNLLENAVRYTQFGFVRISILKEDGKIRVKIEDSGMGIPLAEQNRIFEKFVRASNAKKLYSDGSGLGLFIVKKIVESHKGGRVWFSSEEGKGTTFFVEFLANS